MTVNASIPFDAIREIRDRALMLSLGRAYLCESAFLTKYGDELEHALGLLDRDIRKLKERFPGKFAEEVNTDQILQGMGDLIQRLKAPDKHLEEQCTVGQLSQDLEARLKEMTNAIRMIRTQVDGGPTASYGGREAVAAAVSRAGDAARGGLSLLGKIFGVILVVAIVAFGYLFLTMEREGGYEEVIDRSRQQVQAFQEELADLEEEIRPIEERISKLEQEGTTRMDKVRMMELSVELQDLEQKAQSFQGKIDLEKKKIEEARESLRVLREKGWAQRLLRQ